MSIKSINFHDIKVGERYLYSFRDIQGRLVQTTCVILYAYIEDSLSQAAYHIRLGVDHIELAITEGTLIEGRGTVGRYRL